MNTRHARIRRPCSASREPGCQSTFSPRDLRALMPILHAAHCNLHSRNPYCTAVFCAVPRNGIFSFGDQIDSNFEFGASLAFSIWEPGHSRRGPGRPAPAGSTFPSQVPAIINSNDLSRASNCRRGSLEKIRNDFTFSSQVSDLTLFNPFYPRPKAPRSTSFHQKSPDHNSRSEGHLWGNKLVAGLGSQIPPIPLNSTYAVPPKST